jgi:hypothetical protein
MPLFVPLDAVCKKSFIKENESKVRKKKKKTPKSIVFKNYIKYQVKHQNLYEVTCPKILAPL